MTGVSSLPSFESKPRGRVKPKATSQDVGERKKEMSPPTRPAPAQRPALADVSESSKESSKNYTDCNDGFDKPADVFESYMDAPRGDVKEDGREHSPEVFVEAEPNWKPSVKKTTTSTSIPKMALLPTFDKQKMLGIRREFKWARPTIAASREKRVTQHSKRVTAQKIYRATAGFKKLGGLSELGSLREPDALSGGINEVQCGGLNELQDIEDDDEEDDEWEKAPCATKAEVNPTTTSLKMMKCPMHLLLL